MAQRLVAQGIAKSPRARQERFGLPDWREELFWPVVRKGLVRKGLVRKPRPAKTTGVESA